MSSLRQQLLERRKQKNKASSVRLFILHSFQSAKLSNKVVEAVLRSLTARVNVSTGIGHPRDREAAIQAFMILRDGGERFVPDEIKAWLVSKGDWKPTDAQEVAEVAQKVIEGRRLRYGKWYAIPAWATNILEIWREEARKLSGANE